MESAVVMLAVYNGEAFLEDQLDSLFRQTVSTVHIVASDDGSTDRSLVLLKEAQAKWTKGEFFILRGPRQGYSDNFRMILENSKLDADCFAFCDQDDIWDDDKLERAITHFRSCDNQFPQVYATNSRLIDENGKPLGLFRRFSRPAEFGNAIIQNIASGHALHINKAAFELALATTDQMKIIGHDHWTYLIVTGAKGGYHYSQEPSVSYRQHPGNVVGAKHSISGRIARILRVFNGEVKRESGFKILALDAVKSKLTNDALRILDDYKYIHRTRSPFARVKRLRRSNIYRQTTKGKYSMYVLCFMGLI